MSEPENSYNAMPPPEDIPEAIVQRRSGISVVWIIPLIAAFIGAWLTYKTYSEQGPVITIAFKEAEGIEAGKTKIRYKNVEIGQVREVALRPDLAGVQVTVDMVNDAERYLTDKTRFWIVHARVAAGQISGLGTLFSGAYIGMDPVLEGEPSTTFVGLETPPTVTTDDPGRYFVLRSDRLGSLDIGSPVFYRQVRVGDVVGHHLSDNRKTVDIRIFVRDPYHTLVQKSTRFWNAAGVDIAVDAGGVRIDAESLASILIGGVAFETPENVTSGGPAEADATFRLYDKHDDIYEPIYRQKTLWMLNFTGSVRGLAVGAPVEFRGIRIGKVRDVRLNVDIADASVRIPVVIEIEPGRFGELNRYGPVEASEDLIDRLVAKGLRAQLKAGNLITGQLFVDLDMYPNAPSRAIVRGDMYPELPTVPRPLEELQTNLTQILSRIEKFPFEELGSEMRSAIADLRITLEHTSQLSGRMNDEIAPAFKQTLEQAQTTLRAVDAAAQPDSTTQLQLKQTLKELSEAARSLRQLTDYLERHPDAIIRGKPK